MNEWARRIVVDGGGLAAEIVDELGRCSRIPVRDLTTRGVPAAVSGTHRLRFVNLGEAKRAPATEYLSAFGFRLQSSELFCHTIFEFRSARKRWLVPALAFMRGLFRPAKHLLPDVFLPQMLDRVCMRDDDAPGGLRLTAPWARRLHRHGDPTTLLSWMLRDLSANRMAHSAHARAMCGHVDLELPTVEVNLTMHGIQRRDVFHATNCTVTQVLGVEAAQVGNDLSKANLVLHATRNRDSGLPLANRDLHVTRRADGNVTLTDAEWVAARPIFAPLIQGAKAQVDHRKVLDGLLLKISGAVPTWRAMSGLGLPHVTYGYYYRRWLAAEALQGCLQLLDAMRTSGDDARSSRHTPPLARNADAQGDDEAQLHIEQSAFAEIEAQVVRGAAKEPLAKQA